MTRQEELEFICIGLLNKSLEQNRWGGLRSKALIQSIQDLLIHLAELQRSYENNDND